MDNQGRQISAGNAAKIAADIALESVRSNLDPDSVVQVWAGILPAVTSNLIGVSESVELPEPTQPAPTPGFQPQQALMTAFPGSQVVTSQAQPATAPQAAPAAPAAYVAPPVAPAPSNVVPFPVQPQGPSPFPAQGPAPVPGVGNGEDPETAQAWAMFFNDIATGQYANNWKDNRGSKRGPRSADFVHNTLKQQSNPKYALSLWIDGKKNPAYVAGELAKLGIA
jgi:hypothetical protein